MFSVYPIGLRGRFILLLLAAFAMIFAMIAQHTVAHRAEKIADASTHLLDDAKLIAARQQKIVAQANAILNGLMLQPELRAGASGEDCSHVLSERLQQEKEFVQIGKVLPNGEVACAAVSPSNHINLSDRNWFRQALQSENLVVGDVVMGRIVGKPVTVLAKAMRDDAGRATGVVFVSLNLDWLQRQLAEAGLPEDSRLVVVDAKGTVVARHPDHDGWIGRSAAQTPVFQSISARKGPGTIEGPGLEGKPRLIAFTPLLETVSGPMILWLSTPKAAVMAPVQHELVTSLSLAVMVLLLTLGLAFWGGEKLLLRPLLTLSRTATRLGEGDFGTRTNLPHGDDEIGRLARTLDETAAAIEDRERRLAYANRALRVLSAGNRALLRCKTEQELGQEMCRAIVEAGGYRLAWVGYAEDDKRVQPVASWNAAGDFFDGLNITWDETESGRGPTGTAIRHGMPIASSNLQNDPEYAPWRDRAQRYGYAASLALPLRVDGAVIGALNIYAAEPDAFDEEVIELLGESADDLSFGIAALRDEVEQKRTQAALHAAEERFRAVAEASLDALFILRSVRGEHGEILDFEFTDLNPRAEQMLDMARDKVVGQKLCELLPVNRSGGFFDKYVTVATTGTPLEEEFPIDIPEIKAKWVRHQIVRVGDGIAISSRDITQWKQMAAEARQQGRLRKQIMRSVGEGIFGLDTEGRATFVNPAATAMLQWTEDELVGQPMHALHHHTRADGTPYPGKECPIYEAYRDGKVHRVDDEVFWRKDGTSYPVEYVSTPILDDQGVLTGAVVSFTDISARKQAEQALRDSEERFRVTMENIRDAFILINGEDERILLWNPAAEEMFGYSQEEIIGQPMHQLIVPPRFHEAAYAGLARFTQTGEGAAVGRTNELMALRRDGAEFPVEM
ncbi:MAG: PAS domain S-box protein, partial [Gammaproteobacteria bacterium]|nr:PAS domain S-box protein [Gammaproteobacteria bacterium]